MNRIKSNKAIKILLIFMMFIALLPTNIIKLHAQEEYNLTIIGLDKTETVKVKEGTRREATVVVYEDDQAFSHWEVVSGGPIVFEKGTTEPWNFFVMPSNDVVIKAVYVQGYSIKMEGGCGHIRPYNISFYLAIREIMANANRKVVIWYKTDSEGKEFSHWEVIRGGITLENTHVERTSFIMPENDVVIKCVEKGGETYSITIEDGYAVNHTTGVTASEALPGHEIKIYSRTYQEGMVFDHWEVIDGGITLGDVNDSITSFIMPGNDVILKAHHVKGHKIQIENGYKYNTTIKTWFEKSGNKVYIEVGSLPLGKVFSHWEVVSGSVTLDDANDSMTSFIMPDGDVNIKAVLIDEKHSILVDGGYAYYEGSLVTEAASDQIIDIIAASPSSGKLFSHWEVVSGNIKIAQPGRRKTHFTMAKEDVSVKAIFKDSYNIDVEGGTSSVDSVDTTSTIAGKQVYITVNNIPKGQAFSHWEVVGGSITLDNPYSTTTFFTMPEEDVSVKAVFEKGIDVEVIGGFAQLDGYEITQALKNQTISIRADAPPLDKEFAYWVVHDGGIVVNDSTKPVTSFDMGDKKVRIEAVYTDTYKVNVLPGTNGSVVADKVNNVLPGETIGLVVTADSGYVLDELVVKDSSNRIVPLVHTYFVMPASDVEVKATFKPKDPITFDLSTKVIDGHGSISKGKKDLPLNSIETITFMPVANYEIDYVTVNGIVVVVSGNVYNLTMDSDKHVEVKYKKIGSASTPQPTTVNLTTKVLSGKGDVSKGMENVPLNSTETITFTPEVGFEIEKVTVNGVEVTVVGNSYHLTMDSDKHVEVSYKDVRPIHYISYNLNGGTLQGKTGQVAILVREGETIKLPAAPYKPGYRFSYWKGSKYYPGDNYVVRSGHTFTAQWEKLSLEPINNSTMIVNPSNEVTHVKVKIPKTKDTTQSSLWLMMMVMSLVGLFGFYSLNKKREHR
ncbi:hypothetical protein EII25_02050 [Erysipelotrichaceae bacterium OH741_COT-311]|nr:hypothetical protein EII25_02050 [Erysipelotrichaceae bacterium OH741_COT-311]